MSCKRLEYTRSTLQSPYQKITDQTDAAALSAPPLIKIISLFPDKKAYTIRLPSYLKEVPLPVTVLQGHTPPPREEAPDAPLSQPGVEASLPLEAE